MNLEGKRIFIVEDNATNRAIIQTILERHGVTIGFDRWGKDTCKRLHEFAPVDLVILDLMFPNNITGYDIFDSIRQLSQFRHVPVVAVSAADPSEAIPTAQARGFAGFISKPIDFVRFCHQIAEILDGNELWYTHQQFS